jgi:hypothetical protein
MGLVLEAFKHCVEGFVCGPKHSSTENFEEVAYHERQHHFTLAIAYILLFAVMFVLILLFGKYLWNEIAVKYITIFKPIPSVLELLGLMILVSLFIPV